MHACIHAYTHIHTLYTFETRWIDINKYACMHTSMHTCTHTHTLCTVFRRQADAVAAMRSLEIRK